MYGIPDDADLRRRVAAEQVYTDPLYVVVARKRAAAGQT
jgi:hypothetical protein